MITDELEKLIAQAEPLGDEARVLAALARRIASELDSEGLAPYAISQLSRELRAALAALSGAPDLRPGLADDDYAALMAGLL